MIAQWIRKKVAAIYNWIATDAKNDEDISYAEYEKYRRYADEARYKVKEHEEAKS